MFRFGVFVARCTISFFQIEYLPIFPILQLTNFVILLTHVIFGYLPSVIIVLVIILWEGLIGGASYAKYVFLFNKFHNFSFYICLLFF
jgi:battenin